MIYTKCAKQILCYKSAGKMTSLTGAVTLKYKLILTIAITVLNSTVVLKLLNMHGLQQLVLKILNFSVEQSQCIQKVLKLLKYCVFNG